MTCLPLTLSGSPAIDGGGTPLAGLAAALTV